MLYKINLLIIITMIPLLFGCNNVDISQYSGDGIIKKIGSFPFSEGYQITFDKIVLNQHYSNIFHLKNFPKINKTINFGLIFSKLNVDDMITNCNGDLKFILKDVDGVEVFYCNAEVKAWRISSSSEEDFMYFFERNHGTYISSEKQENIDDLMLEVSYVPFDSQVSDCSIEGHIIARSGGHK